MSSQSVAKTTKAVKKCASQHFLPYFKNKSIQSINRDRIENYQLKRRLDVLNMPKNIGKREHEISFRFVNIEIATLSNFFNFCITKGYTDNNPANKMKRLNELSRLKTLSDEDIENLINKAPLKHTKDLITFLIFTGCRKGEVLNLKWDDVDLKNDVIAIKATKTKHDRYIPIHLRLKTLLENIEKKENCEYVFNFKGRKITTFVDSFHTACRNAGLKDLRIHDLRHVFASKMVMNGTSLYITGELLGHRTTQMTKRYSHLVPDTLKKALNDVWSKYKIATV
jgi:integrase